MDEIDFIYDKEKLQECLVKLVGGVVVVKVGVVIEIEMKDKKFCLEDVINVIKVVVEEGIVFGGGIILVYLVLVLEQWVVFSLFGEELIGVNIVVVVFMVLFMCIVENVGVNGVVVVENVKVCVGVEGFNVVFGEYVDMLVVGIVDFVKVICFGL